MVWGSIPGRGRKFFSSPKCPVQLRGPPRLFFSEHRRSSQGIKWLVCDVNNSPPSGYKFRMFHLVCLHGMDRDSFKFFLNPSICSSHSPISVWCLEAYYSTLLLNDFTVWDKINLGSWHLFHLARVGKERLCSEFLYTPVYSHNTRPWLLQSYMYTELEDYLKWFYWHLSVILWFCVVQNLNCRCWNLQYETTDSMVL
jgi:hypothetical protein